VSQKTPAFGHYFREASLLSSLRCAKRIWVEMLRCQTASGSEGSSMLSTRHLIASRLCNDR